MSDIHGVIPPIITPFDDDGRINEKAFAVLVDWYAEAGCHGLWVCGGTGEGVRLTEGERAQMVDLAAECALGRMKVMFHVGAVTTREAAAAARRCADRGLDAISSVPPLLGSNSEREIIDYYRCLAGESGLPLFLYNLPGAVGYSVSPTMVQRIAAAVPQVTGIKHSSGRLEELVEMMRLVPELTFITGRGELMLSALVAGAHGAVCASLCMAPEKFLAVYEAFQEGDLARAVACQREATAVKDIYARFPVVASTKYVNQLQTGHACGPPRLPAAAVAAKREAELVEMARGFGLLSAEKDAPAPSAT